MFSIGELIVYGNTGVCKVVEIGKPSTLTVNDGKDYYTLEPYYTNKSRIFVPCDNERIVMRPILSKDQAQALVDDAASVSELEVPIEKLREEIYKTVMKSCDCREFLKLLKTIHLRKNQRLAEGKKVTTSDEKYFNMAEEKLYGELAISLEKDKVEIKEYILKVFEAGE